MSSNKANNKSSTPRRWTFNVTCKTFPGEVVCITGSCPELGNWKVKHVRPMETQEDCTSFTGFGGEKEEFPWVKPQRSTWTLTVDLPKGADITYRYIVCCIVDSADPDETQKNVVVRRWETQLRPRKIACHEKCDSQTVAVFGSAGVDDLTLTQRGWLTVETVVQLKLFGEKALHIWKKKHKGKDFYVKITPVKAEKCLEEGGIQSAFSDDSQSMDLCATRDKFQRWPLVEVAKLSSDDCYPRPQSQFGIRYEDGGFVLFQAQVLQTSTVAFLVDIFACPEQKSSSFDPAELIGSCYIMPKHFVSTSGRIKETIISSTKFEAIGEISVEFLVVHPLKDPNMCDFAVTFAKHWNSNWKGIDVGHRGLGNSFTKLDTCSHLRENTISSLKYAYSHGADMVEFDVQLSKDKIPVIYHDFELCTTSVAKDGEQRQLIPTQLKNLTLNQLRSLKIHHTSAMPDKGGEMKEFAEESVEDQAFPTLHEALETIDPGCGFNIELKWDMMLKDGSNECHTPFEINLFLNAVLETVLKHGQKRKIVFSSFNPDVCTMIRLKQNRYPVLLLTQGINSKYDDYLDPRTWTIENGSNFVAMAEILGVNAMAEDIQRDPGQVQTVQDRGQVIFVWTDDRNDSGTVKYLKELGVDGIIYDRMDVNNSKDTKTSVFLCGEEDEVEKQARSPKSGCSCSPPGSPMADETGETCSNNTLDNGVKNVNTFTGALLAKS